MQRHNRMVLFLMLWLLTKDDASAGVRDPVTVCRGTSNLLANKQTINIDKKGAITASGVISDAGKAVTDLSLISVAIETSRSQSVLGTRLGVVAEIKNISKIGLRFNERETVIVIPPEARIYGVDSPFEGCTFFPTEGNPRLGAPLAALGPKGRDVSIQSGESYRVFWDVGTNGCSVGGKMLEPTVFSFDWWKLQWQRIMFTLGSYKVVFSTRFYDATAKDDTNYHTASATQSVTLSAPQSMILLGAALGGILAWAVKRYMRSPTTTFTNGGTLPSEAVAATESAIKIINRLNTVVPSSGSLLEFIGSGVLSVVLVILASRISDAFPVKVNANDFWGAITLGFVANYTGVALLQRISGGSSAPTSTTPPAAN